MAKDKTVYVCGNCGQESPKWIGRCPSCGEWNTFKEFTVRKESAAAMAGSYRQASAADPLRAAPVPVGQIAADEEPRMDTPPCRWGRLPPTRSRGWTCATGS